VNSNSRYVMLNIFKDKLESLEQEVSMLKDEQDQLQQEENNVMSHIPHQKYSKMNIREYVQELVRDNWYQKQELSKLDKLYKNHRGVVGKLKDQLGES